MKVERIQKEFVLKRALIILVLDVCLCAILYSLLPYAHNENLGICLLVFVGILWLTEAMHVSLTALLVPVLSILLGLQNTSVALSSFANPIIFLFFGGFALATALHIQGIDRLIAQKLIILAKGRVRVAVFMLFAVTALLSMWISNTATAAIMLPLGLGILSNLSAQEERQTFVFVLLGIAYSASIGGFGTLVGSPPNAIAASSLGIGFLDWMKIGIPFMLVMFPCCLLILYIVMKPNLNERFSVQFEKMEWNLHKTITSLIFVGMAMAWIFSKWISVWLGGIQDIDAMIALIGVVVIGLSGIASWREIQKNTDWGVLFLFGGGLALGGIIKDSGASAVMANTIAKALGMGDFGSNVLGVGSWILVIVVLAIFIILLTEFTSNTASASLLIPIFASLSVALNMPDSILTLVIGFGAGCAFMLPVATPPNAIVFGTGYIKQSEMIKAGFWLGVFSVFVLTLFALFIWS
ncbi:DASS family sodium-coupled anion symporter [Helicobacter turcicus]|uniref:DASS family sodium-coupled anion symporter n=1 Tax=Helicobacter turcicus TaxID=2867412 RepID=A0ABS7JKG2_9HELI|nr:DASS family sodium-coupled anion symporter [Helicobacter turcicus]MBX7489866.1 DASS family sodium-coupled anion symporter [Helicobacter turcicus]MBX7544726.1 DASS family sodium-coupled anion symporter [Helicobacter turcicus]